ITAAQNAASVREIGVATSSVTFFRSMGGTIGAAVFLSILFSRLPGKIQHAYSDAATTPAFQHAAAIHPVQLRALQAAPGTSGAGSLADTSFLKGLEPVLAHPFKAGFASSMTVVYYIAAAITVLTLLITLMLPELPLSRLSPVERLQAETAAKAWE